MGSCDQRLAMGTWLCEAWCNQPWMKKISEDNQQVSGKETPSRPYLFVIARQYIGVKLGLMPVRYQSPHHKEARDEDCASLVEKITNRIDSWTSTYFSCAGRLQHIQSTPFTMQNFLVKTRLKKFLNSALLSSGKERKVAPVKAGMI
ncbi:hypothetical protein SCA6_013249 [Theobroma cacao]